MNLSLNGEEKRTVMLAILQNSDPGDESPCVVIARDYDHDEDAYLRVMAVIHHIPLSDA